MSEKVGHVAKVREGKGVVAFDSPLNCIPVKRLRVVDNYLHHPARFNIFKFYCCMIGGGSIDGGQYTVTRADLECREIVAEARGPLPPSCSTHE